MPRDISGYQAKRGGSGGLTKSSLFPKAMSILSVYGRGNRFLSLNVVQRKPLRKLRWGSALSSTFASYLMSIGGYYFCIQPLSFLFLIYTFICTLWDAFVPKYN